MLEAISDSQGDLLRLDVMTTYVIDETSGFIKNPRVRAGPGS
jgi:hypothetical protein